MPRAQRTKSAVHEALQRRASKRPGDSLSGELGGAVQRAPFAVLAIDALNVLWNVDPRANTQTRAIAPARSVYQSRHAFVIAREPIADADSQNWSAVPGGTASL